MVLECNLWDALSKTFWPYHYKVEFPDGQTASLHLVCKCILGRSFSNEVMFNMWDTIFTTHPSLGIDALSYQEGRNTNNATEIVPDGEKEGYYEWVDTQRLEQLPQANWAEILRAIMQTEKKTVEEKIEDDNGYNTMD